MVIGKLILCGRPDTFVAALQTVKTVSNASSAVTGWNFVCPTRATVSNDVVTLLGSGTYTVRLWSDEAYGGLNVGRISTSMFLNSRVQATDTQFTASAGDTIRFRVTGNGTDLRQPRSLYMTAIIERID